MSWKDDWYARPWACGHNDPIYVNATTQGCAICGAERSEPVLARDLKPGNVFRVENPDPEGPLRVCLTNDGEQGLRFGFVGKSGYWCYMGDLVEVEVCT